MPEMTHRGETLSIGRLADAYGVTVRTLHHYDDTGLLCPGEHSRAGYRLYTADDVTRLQSIVVYRRLGFPLDEISALLDDPDADVAAHLRRQRAAVMSKLDELGELVHAIDRALEKEVSGLQLTTEEQRELFGDGYNDELAQEAYDRWGETDAWKQSQQRTASYTKEDWERIKAEGDAVNAAYAAAFDAGLPATSVEAMDAAESARQHIATWFHDLPSEQHRHLGEMYVNDERFRQTYEDLRTGLAVYVRDAIAANADRQTDR